MSLNEALGTLPSGKVVALKDDELTRHLRDRYLFNDVEAERRKRTRMRIDLYHDKGEKQIDKMVDDIFKNSQVRQLRKKFVELASFQNLTKRIIREISSVYSESATRRVQATNLNSNYQRLQSDMRLDRRMRLANQMLNLCNDVVVWFDLRFGRPFLRVVTPDNFFAVCHPNDPTQLVGLIFDQAPASGNISTDTPYWLVVSDTESFSLNQDGRLLSETRRAHGLSRMPMQLVHRSEPMTCLLTPDPGSDIIAAHKAITLINVMMLKHQKSGTKQAVASGDLGEMPRGQPMDEEYMLQAPEGVSINTLDLGADPDNYIKAGRSVIKQISANYGIPESVFDLSYQATSGFEIELKRTGLREVRRDQILDWRPVERSLAEIMVEALAESRDEFAAGYRFSMTGWGVNFGEVETPQDPMQRLVYWEKQRKMGLINTVDMLMHLNPEMTEEQAEERLGLNAVVEAKRIDLFRKLNISPNTAADGTKFNSESSEAAMQSSDLQSENPSETGTQ